MKIAIVHDWLTNMGGAEQVVINFNQIYKDAPIYTTFYNPMLNLLGDRVTPEGSYYYSTDPYLSYYWYIFDQVVIRPSIIENFNFDKLEIIKDVSDYSLVTDLSIPNKDISDHLPIFFSIN